MFLFRSNWPGRGAQLHKKRLGWVTLGRVMAAVGLVLQVSIDPAAQASPSARPAGEPRSHWRHQRGPAWGKRMAARRALKLTAEQRSDIARNAALARWSRPNKEAPASGRG